MSSGSTRWSVWIAVLYRLRGTSSHVYTRCTPGTASAADLSIETMRACACGECSTFRCSIPSISVSIVYSARPVTTPVPAGAPTLAPTASPGCRLFDLGDAVDGILDRPISGAATHRSRGQRHADVAADGGAVPHLERRQEGLAARGEQRVPAQWHQVDQAAKIRLLIGEQPGPARQPGVAFAPVAAGSIGRVSDNFGDGVDVHVKWPFDGWDRGTPGLETLRS